MNRASHICINVHFKVLSIKDISAAENWHISRFRRHTEVLILGCAMFWGCVNEEQNKSRNIKKKK